MAPPTSMMVTPRFSRMAIVRGMESLRRYKDVSRLRREAMAAPSSQPFSRERRLSYGSGPAQSMRCGRAKGQPRR
jgi:hypothetical protein